MVEDKGEAKSLYQLNRYVAVLAEAYPEPIRATELAQKTGLSKPAVTKVRDRLMQICNPKAMALDKGFVLLDDFNVLYKLFQVYAANGRHRQFFQSRFVRSFIVSRPIHAKIVQSFPLYGQYFSEDDTKFLVGLCMEIVSGLEPSDLQDLMKSISRKTPLLADYRILAKLQRLVGELKILIQNENEFRRILVLRDKLFFLSRDYLWEVIETMKILEPLEQKERTKYLEVYKHTVDFYLRQLFESLNSPIVDAAKASKINYTSIKMDVGATALEVGQEET